jgi:threonine dehydratase
MTQSGLAISDILEAQKRLQGQAIVTPLLPLPLLSEDYAGSFWVKAENLQRTGSFKFRGAYNALKQIADQDQKTPIVAASSGNHAQGIAEAARLLGLKAHIVMPHDAPEVKVNRVRRSGGIVHCYDRHHEDRNSIAQKVKNELEAHYVAPFDDWRVMAGQGTAGLDIVEQLSSIGKKADHVLICCSGGGLSAGMAVALHHHWPNCRLYTVEPEGFDDMARSLKAGKRVRNEKTSGYICDALLIPEPGEKTFPILQKHITAGLTVSDEETRQAMAYAFHECKLVLEPGGAVALAALLQNKLADWFKPGESVVAVLSGGNVAPSVLGEALESYLPLRE